MLTVAEARRFLCEHPPVWRAQRKATDGQLVFVVSRVHEHAYYVAYGRFTTETDLATVHRELVYCYHVPFLSPLVTYEAHLFIPDGRIHMIMALQQVMPSVPITGALALHAVRQKRFSLLETNFAAQQVSEFTASLLRETDIVEKWPLKLQSSAFGIEERNWLHSYVFEGVDADDCVPSLSCFSSLLYAVNCNKRKRAKVLNAEERQQMYQALVVDAAAEEGNALCRYLVESEALESNVVRFVCTFGVPPYFAGREPYTVATLLQNAIEVYQLLSVSAEVDAMPRLRATDLAELRLEAADFLVDIASFAAICTSSSTYYCLYEHESSWSTACRWLTRYRFEASDKGPADAAIVESTCELTKLDSATWTYVTDNFCTDFRKPEPNWVSVDQLGQWHFDSEADFLECLYTTPTALVGDATADLKLNAQGLFMETNRAVWVVFETTAELKLQRQLGVESTIVAVSPKTALEHFPVQANVVVVDVHRASFVQHILPLMRLLEQRRPSQLIFTIDPYALPLEPNGFWTHLIRPALAAQLPYTVTEVATALRQQEVKMTGAAIRQALKTKTYESALPVVVVSKMHFPRVWNDTESLSALYRFDRFHLFAITDRSWTERDYYSLYANTQLPLECIQLYFNYSMLVSSVRASKRL